MADGIIPDVDMFNKIRDAVRAELQRQRGTNEPTNNRPQYSSRAVGFTAGILLAGSDPRLPWGQLPSVNVDVYYPQADGGLVDAGYQVRAYSRLDVRLEQTTYVELIHKFGQWYLEVANCSTTDLS